MAETLPSGMDVTSLMNAGGKGDLRTMVTSAATEAGLDPNFVHRLVTAESNWNPSAKSNKGATGLMQLMPETAKQYGVTNLTDPKENVKAGIAYLKDLSARFPGRQDLIAAAYNAGPGAVEKAGGVPKFAETQAYVKKVAGGEIPPDWIREDGSVKGTGFLGLLQRPDGGVMSEYSVSTDRVKGPDGKPIDFPTFVPTLTKDEVQALLNSKDGQPVPQSIIQKAEAHALQRQQAGKSVWADPSEAQTGLYPELKRASLPAFLQTGSGRGGLASGTDVTALMSGAKGAAKEEPASKVVPIQGEGGYLQGLKEGVVGGAKGFVEGLASSPGSLVRGVGTMLSQSPVTTAQQAVESVKALPSAFMAAGANPEQWGQQVGDVTGQTMIGMVAPKALPTAWRGAVAAREAVAEQPLVKGLVKHIGYDPDAMALQSERLQTQAVKMRLQAAKSRARVAAAKEEMTAQPVATEPTVKLYRGESSNSVPGPNAGRNFTTDPSVALSYAWQGGGKGRIFTTELPASEAAKYHVPNAPEPGTHLLPQELADQARAKGALGEKPSAGPPRSLPSQEERFRTLSRQIVLTPDQMQELTQLRGVLKPRASDVGLSYAAGGKGAARKIGRFEVVEE